jgi:hypothetical protein
MAWILLISASQVARPGSLIIVFRLLMLAGIIYVIELISTLFITVSILYTCSWVLFRLFFLSTLFSIKLFMWFHLLSLSPLCLHLLCELWHPHIWADSTTPFPSPPGKAVTIASWWRNRTPGGHNQEEKWFITSVFHMKPDVTSRLGFRAWSDAVAGVELGLQTGDT